MSPSARTLQKLRKDGWIAAVTERWNSYAKVRQDLWNFADVLAFRGFEIMAVQATSGENVSHRLEKILANEKALAWVSAPNRKLVIHGWAKRGRRNEAKHWTCREVEVTLAMFEAGTVPQPPQPKEVELAL